MNNDNFSRTKHRVFHLIHKEKTGGVEIAIMRSRASLSRSFDYRVYSVMSFKEGKYSYSIFQLIYDVVRCDHKILISSLWFSHLIAYFLSIFSESWIAFFHSASIFHWKDRIGKTVALKFADAFFCDSGATANFHKLDEYYLIPYVFTSKTAIETSREIEFLYVARADPVKRIDRFIDLVNLLKKDNRFLQAHIYTDTSFYTLVSEYQRESLNNYKIFINAPLENISQAMLSSKFFVSTSEKEGFGSAIAEAINSGCVPIITKVGEPVNYLDDEAAVYLSSFNTFNKIEVEKIKHLMLDENSRKGMSEKAMKNLSSYGNYTETMVKSIHCHIVEKRL